MKPRVREVIVVEGKYDRNTVSQVVDCTIVDTSGFSIFSDKEKIALLRRLAEKRGIIIMTDSDGAGFLIRGHLKGMINSGTVKHAYTPDIKGRERRKRQSSGDGLLGVEGMRPEVIVDSLRRAGATFEDECGGIAGSTPVTKADFFDLGLTGAAGSNAARAELCARLSLPSRMTANALLDVINALYSREDFLGLYGTKNGNTGEK